MFTFDKIATKPTTLEIRRAIETLVNFSMFTESGEIDNMTMVSALVQKELATSMKQKAITDFLKKM